MKDGGMVLEIGLRPATKSEMVLRWFTSCNKICKENEEAKEDG